MATSRATRQTERLFARPARITNNRSIATPALALFANLAMACLESSTALKTKLTCMRANGATLASRIELKCKDALAKIKVVSVVMNYSARRVK